MTRSSRAFRRPTLFCTGKRVPLLLLLILVAGLVTAAPAAAEAPVRASSAGAREEARETLDEAQALLDGRGVRTGKELTPVLKDLAIRMRALPSGDRAEARRLLQRPTAGQVQPGEEAYRADATEHQICTEHFCIHWVTNPDPSDPDPPPLADPNGNGIPEYVETMGQVFEHVYAVENVAMGWREPTPDGTNGGDFNKTDVYIKQLGDPKGEQSIFGYATVDPGQEANSQASFLVMDDDYASNEFRRYTEPVAPMQVTAAHEYNHVVQFGYDVLQDAWMFESTAVWMEDKVYDDINDYLSYLPGWSKRSELPLTQFNAGDLSDPDNVKVYGDIVWNRWIDERYGQDTIRAAWEKSLQTRPISFAPDAYDAALLAQGTTFFDSFTRFAADTAEWRTAGFEEGNVWPDVVRATDRSLAPGGQGVEGTLDHASFALVNVTPTSDAKIKLIGSLPRGTRGAFALVGREGDEAGGAVTLEMRRLATGGQTSVELVNPGRFARLTAVLVNADMTQSGFSQFTGDWEFAKDNQAVLAHVSSDYKPPRVRKRSPGPNAKVSPRSKVVVTFSERMQNVSSKTFDLVAPGGKHVSARVSYDAAKRRATLTPKKPLSPRRRYVVKIGSTVVDLGDNPLASSERTWKFSTRSR
jgi:hypothetical protein